MSTSLSRRLDKLNEALDSWHPSAEYVVDTLEERKRVRGLFLEIWFPPPPGAVATPPDLSLPVQKRMTYKEAIEAGIVVETKRLQLAVEEFEQMRSVHFASAPRPS